VRLIGWLCVMGAGISLMVGLASGTLLRTGVGLATVDLAEDAATSGVFLRKTFRVSFRAPSSRLGSWPSDS